MHAKHYKHNEDGRTAPGVCGNGSVPLSHSGNVVTRIGTYTHTHTFRASLDVSAVARHHAMPAPLLFVFDLQCTSIVTVCGCLSHGYNILEEKNYTSFYFLIKGIHYREVI